MTQPLHHIDPAWVAVLAAAVLTATGIVTANTLRSVNWNFALLFGLFISLATVFERTGIEAWIGQRLGAAVGDLTRAPIAFVLGLTLLCIGVSFVIRWQAAAPLITIAIAPLASAGGIHPFVVGLVAVLAANTFFLPYQCTAYLALYDGTGGKLFTHSQAVPAAISYAIWVLIATAASVPAWRLMGLL
jgi:di/tricarboxylate transporter